MDWGIEEAVREGAHDTIIGICWYTTKRVLDWFWVQGSRFDGSDTKRLYGSWWKRKGWTVL
jgi:hypothetical protein